MTFLKVKKLMAKVGTGFLATTDGRCATVRPMSAYLWVGRELWLATGLKNAKVIQVRKRPGVEFCCMAENFVHVRIAGRARVSTVPRDKQRIFRAFPWMKNYFASPTAADWGVIRLTPRKVRVMEFPDLKYAEVKVSG